MKKLKSSYLRFFKLNLLMLASLPLLSGCYVGGDVIGTASYMIASIQDFTVQDGTASGVFQVNGVALDSSGNIYLTGYAYGSLDGQTVHGTYDLFITKYNSSGVLQWTVQDGAASSTTTGNSIATDSAGNVYVAGYTSGAIDGQTLHGSSDLFITKYNSAGIRQWTVEDGAASANIRANGIAIDSTGGSVYVVGYTNKAIDGQTLHGTYDLFITKYNTSGTRQWTVQDGAASGLTYAFAVAFDPLGYVYVTGESNKNLDGQTEHGSTSDFILTKYNTSGTRQWTVEDGTSGGQSIGYSLAIDSSSNPCVAVFTNVPLDGQTQHGTFDLAVTKYNSSGVLQWTTQDGTTGGQATVAGLALDSSNNIYMTGYTYTKGLDGNALQGIFDLFLTKYNSTGTRQWTVEEGGSGGEVGASSVALDSAGNIYIGGYTSIAMNGQTQHGSSDLLLMQFKATGSQ